MAQRKPMDNTAYRRRRAVIGEASDIEFRGGLPIGSSNFTVGPQLGPAVASSADAAVPMSKSGFRLGSSNEAVGKQSALYASNVGRTLPRDERTVDSPAPRSDGTRFDFLTE